MRRFKNPNHPGETLLEDFLLPMGMSQRALAAALGWPPRKLNELVTGKRGITADSALELAYTLGTSMELWMYLQVSWMLYTAAQRKRPLGLRAGPTPRSPAEPLAAARMPRAPSSYESALERDHAGIVDAARRRVARLAGP